MALPFLTHNTSAIGGVRGISGGGVGGGIAHPNFCRIEGGVRTTLCTTCPPRSRKLLMPLNYLYQIYYLFIHEYGYAKDMIAVFTSLILGRNVFYFCLFMLICHARGHWKSIAWPCYLLPHTFYLCIWIWLCKRHEIDLSCLVLHYQLLVKISFIHAHNPIIFLSVSYHNSLRNKWTFCSYKVYWIKDKAAAALSFIQGHK